MQRSVLGTVDSNVLEKAPGRQKRLRRAPQGDGEGCGSDGELDVAKGPQQRKKCRRRAADEHGSDEVAC